MLGALLTLAVLYAQAAPDAAQTQAATPSAAPPASTAKPSTNGVSGVTVTATQRQRDDVDPKEVVCHSEMPIGSRFAKKVCARREDIDDRRRTDQADVRKMTALRPGSGN